MIKKILEYCANLWYALSSKKTNDRSDNAMSKIKSELEKKASNILIENDMLKLPVDLIKIADNYNIDVYYKELPNGISGAIKYDIKDEKFKILLAKNESKRRRRFTLAHELAHYFLAQEELKNNHEIHFDTLYRKATDNNECEVDYLAGALLMNKELLERAYKEIPSIAALAEIFDVSDSAMAVRLMKLGLI